MGDLNARVGREENDKVVGNFGEDVMNDNGERLKEMCGYQELMISNTFFEHRDIHKYTWVCENRNLKSIIDYIICKQRSTIQIWDTRAYRGAQCGSDHFLVGSKIFFPWIYSTQKNKDDRSKLVKEEARFNIQLLQDDSIKDLYKRRLENVLVEEYEGSSDELYEYLKGNILQVAREVVGIIQEKKQQKYWMKEEVLQSIERKKQAFQRWLSSKKEEDKEVYKQKKKEADKVIKEAKNEIWDRTCSTINCQLGFRRSKEAWAVLRNIRQQTRHKVKIDLISAQDWYQHYSTLLSENREEFQEEENLEDREINLMTTEEEIQNVIKNMKNGKSPGPGNVNLELIKYGGNKVNVLITKFINKILQGDNIPEEMKTGYIVSIYKKGDKKICGNYRGINITNPFIKILGNLTKNWIEKEFKGTEDQSGFTAGRSTMDHIFTVRQILQKCNSKQQEVGLIFYDLEKAYDSVPRKLLWEALERAKINESIIHIIKKIYFNNKCRIKIGSELTEEFKTTKGLLQGCTMSPTLFKIYIDAVLQEWSKKCKPMGIKLRDNLHIHNLLFADDQVVITSGIDDANYMGRKLEEEYSKWGLKINYDKTEYMSTDPSEELEINGTKIQTVQNFKYLGSIIQRDGSSDLDIERRVIETRKVIGMLNSILWSRNIIKRTKLLIYKTIVKSILLYGAETWTLKQKHKNKLLVTEMDYLRRSARVSKLDKIKNSIIRERMEMEKDIVQEIEEIQLRWYGHVMRRKDNETNKEVLQWMPPGRRKRGRPKPTWLEGIKDSMMKRDMNEEDCQDRDLWRKKSVYFG